MNSVTLLAEANKNSDQGTYGAIWVGPITETTLQDNNTTLRFQLKLLSGQETEEKCSKSFRVPHLNIVIRWAQGHAPRRHPRRQAPSLPAS